MKKWFEISQDELESRTQAHDKATAPAREASAITREFLHEVVKRLGVDTTKDIDVQLEIMNIFIHEISSEEQPQCAGIYITVARNGSITPFAFIKAPDVDSNGRFVYSPAYWNPRKKDYDDSRRIKIS